MELLLKRGTADDGIASTVPGLKEAHGFRACLYYDLRNERRVIRFGEHWLNAIRLRAEAVNQRDIFPIEITINVVATGKAIAGGKGGWKQNAVRPFNRDEVFADNKRGRAATSKVMVELSEFVVHSCDVVISFAVMKALCLRWPVRNQLSKR